MSTEIDIKNLVKAAKEFAKSKNHGMNSRTRAKLDNMRPALQVLATEKIPMKSIQDFIRSETGMKIGMQPLKSYCQETFGYPVPQDKIIEG
jgi:hypothetical protein